MRPEDIEVTVQGNQVMIQGETKADEERKDERYHFRERRYGRFQRSITLPSNVQADQAGQDYTPAPVSYTISGNAGAGGVSRLGGVPGTGVYNMNWWNSVS